MPADGRRRTRSWLSVSRFVRAFAWLGVVAFASGKPPLAGGDATAAPATDGPVTRSPGRACPKEMVRVVTATTGPYCVDRFEMSTRKKNTTRALSPFYPPEPRMLEYVQGVWERRRFNIGPPSVRRMPLPLLANWQRSLNYMPQAVSVSGVTPQGYLSYHSARRACEAAGKRLCQPTEWETACRGQQQTSFPYGDKFRGERCNVGSQHHPAALLHELSYSGLLDPRLNTLILPSGAPVLWDTGSHTSCVSRWGNDGIFDMVGNLDEWVEDPSGTFRGGFYARNTQRGCSQTVETHDAAYFDYSTGGRCCLSLPGSVVVSHPASDPP